MATSTAATLIARNPADGSTIGEVPVTPPEQVELATRRAAQAQKAWAATPWPARQAALKSWWRALSRDAEGWADALQAEVGKPRSEAMAGDVIPTLDALRWIVRHGGKALAPGRLGPGHQRFLQMPGGRLSYRPYGVIGMIGTWNYPLFLNAGPIAQALAAGNGVVWKPSEFTPLLGRRLQEGIENAGLPDGLVSAVFGGADVGRALVDSPIDKGFFTGGVPNGRRVIAALGARGIPCVAELSGFDPAIVLADAPLESTAKVLAWGAFLNAGQTCVGVKRVIVVGDPEPWAERLAAIARSLRVGNPAAGDVDMGPMINESSRAHFNGMVRDAVAAGAEILCGGSPVPGPGSFYAPTVLRADSPAPEVALAGAFGPVVIVRGAKTADEAVAAANSSEFGLAASVWSRDVRAARAVGARLDAGMVTINEVVTPTMHSTAPFGGTKASGFGRSHGPLGLLEFVQPQATFTRAAGGFRPQVFPYGQTPVDTVLGLYRRLFHW